MRSHVEFLFALSLDADADADADADVFELIIFLTFKRTVIK